MMLDARLEARSIAFDPSPGEPLFCQQPKNARNEKKHLMYRLYLYNQNFLVVARSFHSAAPMQLEDCFVLGARPKREGTMGIASAATK